MQALQEGVSVGVVVVGDGGELHIGQWIIYLSAKYTRNLRLSLLYLSHMVVILWGVKWIVDQEILFASWAQSDDCVVQDSFELSIESYMIVKIMVQPIYWYTLVKRNFGLQDTGDGLKSRSVLYISYRYCCRKLQMLYVVIIATD